MEELKGRGLLVRDFTARACDVDVGVGVGGLVPQAGTCGERQLFEGRVSAAPVGGARLAVRQFRGEVGG